MRKRGQTVEAIVHKKGVQNSNDSWTVTSRNSDRFFRGFILFKSGDTVLTVRQIEDSYPDYDA